MCSEKNPNCTLAFKRQIVKAENSRKKEMSIPENIRCFLSGVQVWEHQTLQERNTFQEGK